MQIKNKLTLLSMIIISILIVGCSSPTPIIIEITREVPMTVVVTQVVTQLVTPENTPTPEFTPTASPIPYVNPYMPLEDCPPSYLKVGIHAVVSYEGESSMIRPLPDMSSAARIGYAAPGEVLTVIGGPVCSFGWLVWQIETQYGLKGWTPETDGENYWLIPLSSLNP